MYAETRRYGLVRDVMYWCVPLIFLVRTTLTALGKRLVPQSGHSGAVVLPIDSSCRRRVEVAMTQEHDWNFSRWLDVRRRA